MVDNSDWREGGMDVRLRWREQRQKNKHKGGAKEWNESRRWRCEKEATEAEEERKDPNACEMKRIKGLHTSRRGRKMCGGRRMTD